MTPDYSVIVPALNEEAGIAAVLERLRKLSPAPEIVVVDDGSTDATGALAKQSGAVVVTHPAPGGYGRSLKDGIRRATHDVVVITDADGTYPVEEIPSLLALIEKGFDMAVGARSGKEYRGSFLKMPARIVFKWLVEFATGRKIPDINSGLRAFRKSAMLPFEHDLCNGFSFTTTITLIYCLTGKFVTYLPIAYAKREGSSKVRIIRDSLRTMQYITEVIVAYNPLKLFVLLAGILGALAALSVLGYFFSWNGDQFYLLLASLFFIGSTGVFAFGLTVRPRMGER